MKKGLFIFLLLTALIAAATSRQVSLADDSFNQLQRQVNGMRGAVQQRGPGRMDPRIVRNAKKAADEATQVMKQVPPTPPPPASTLPVSHVRAEGGIPFPKPEEVVFEVPKIEIPTPDPKYTPWSGPHYSRPTRCEQPSTDRIPLPDDIANGAEQIILDQLYLPEDYVPVDPGEVFGARVSLLPYGPTSSNTVYLHMETDNVPCVPYRIRITNRAMYRDFGNNALRNYDKKLSGSGNFHTWIEQKLFGKK